MSAPRTGGTGCGSSQDWETPQHRDYRSPDLPGSKNYERKKRQGWTIDLNSQVAEKQWATPQAHDSHAGNPARVGRFGTKAGGRSLADEALVNWPTPRATDGTHGGPNQTGGALPAAVQIGNQSATQPNATKTETALSMESTSQTAPASDPHKTELSTKKSTESCTAENWPTPTVQDAENNAGPSQFNRNSQPLNVRVHTAGPQDPENSNTSGSTPERRQLNPAWVAQLMGLPEGWLDVPCY